MPYIPTDPLRLTTIICRNGTLLCFCTHVTGISGKSQLLFALVFTTRYLDIFTNFVSAYNSVMKVVFIVTAYGTLYLMFVKFKATYDSNHDTFRAEFLVIPAAGLAMLVNHEFSVMEVRLCFSRCLLPQVFPHTCVCVVFPRFINLELPCG